MPPGRILLNRCVVDYSFDDDDDDDEPSWSVASASEFIKRTWGAKAASSIAPHNHPMLATLLSLKPPADAAVALLPKPPEIATLMLRTSKSHRTSLPSSRPFVACADKGLLVLYSGSYFGPGPPGSSRCGCYLIHDAADADAGVLSTVPPPPDARDLTEGLASGAVVLRCHPAGPSSSSVYLLAELATMPRRRFPDPDAALLLWRSDEQRWARKEVHLPREVCWVPGDDKHMFDADTSFAGPGGSLCWVDLLHGIVVCTNPHQDPPVLRFVPLPDGCPAFGWSDYPNRPRMEEHRSAACVGGRIKVVAMVGKLERCNAQQYRLTTWTLSSPPSPDPDDEDFTGGDGWQWQEDGVFPLDDLWATEEYRALGLPPQTPICPVLSAARDEDGVLVYAVVNDVEERVVMLGIDVRCNKIVSSSSGVPPDGLIQRTPRLLPLISKLPCTPSSLKQSSATRSFAIATQPLPPAAQDHQAVR